MCFSFKKWFSWHWVWPGMGSVWAGLSTDSTGGMRTRCVHVEGRGLLKERVRTEEGADAEMQCVRAEGMHAQPSGVQTLTWVTVMRWVLWGMSTCWECDKAEEPSGAGGHCEGSRSGCTWVKPAEASYHSSGPSGSVVTPKKDTLGSLFL